MLRNQSKIVVSGSYTLMKVRMFWLLLVGVLAWGNEKGNIDVCKSHK